MLIISDMFEWKTHRAHRVQGQKRNMLTQILQNLQNPFLFLLKVLLVECADVFPPKIFLF